MNNSSLILEKYVTQILTDPANNPDDFSRGGFTWDSEKKKDSWRYFDAVMIDSFVNCAGEEGIAYAKRFLADNLMNDGTPKNYHELELDSVPMGLSIVALLDTALTEDERTLYNSAIQKIYSELLKQPSFSECGGNYLHKMTWTDWNIGLDGMYMAEIFLMRVAVAVDKEKLDLTGENGERVTAEKLYKEIHDRFMWVADTMFDAETGLYHHGWNVEQKKGNGHFWLRGIGWYAVALTDVTDLMPEGAYKEDLKKALVKLFDGMIPYANDRNGMWLNVVNGGSFDGNLLETSGSAMMAYSMMKAANNRLVPEGSLYGTAGLRAFNGICAENVKQNEDGTLVVTDIMQKSGVCVIDKEYCKYPYSDDEAKGTGILIQAAFEAKKMR